MTATVSVERVTTIQRHMASFKEGTAPPLIAFQKMLGLMAAASPVLQLGLLCMRPIQFWLKKTVPSKAWCHGRHRITVILAWVSALALWRDLLWLKQGVILDTAVTSLYVKLSCCLSIFQFVLFPGFPFSLFYFHCRRWRADWSSCLSIIRELIGCDGRIR